MKIVKTICARDCPNACYECNVKVIGKVLLGVIWCLRELIDEKGNPQNGLAQGTPQKIGGGLIFNTVKVRSRSNIR